MGINIFFKGIRSGQKKFGDSIAAVINSILLTFVYSIGVGITFVFAKILGKNFLDLKFEKGRESYWEELNLGREEIDKCYRQF